MSLPASISSPAIQVQPAAECSSALALAPGWACLTGSEQRILSDLLETKSAEKAYRRDADRYGCPYYYEIFTDHLATILLKLSEQNRALRAMAENDSWSRELQDALDSIPARFLTNDYWVNGIRRMADALSAPNQKIGL